GDPCSSARERAQVHLVDDLAFEADARPTAVSPWEWPRIDHLGGAMGATRLKTRRWVWIELGTPIQAVVVQRANPCRGDETREIASPLRRQFDDMGRRALALLCLPLKNNLHTFAARGPDAEVDAPLRERFRPYGKMSVLGRVGNIGHWLGCLCPLDAHHSTPW